MDLVRRAHSLDVVSIVHARPELREELTALCFSAGYVAEPFKGAKEFLESGCRLRTSCLIADMQLPEMSGLQLYKHLVASGKAIPTILLVDRLLDHQRARTLRGCTTHLQSKPFNDNQLLACVKSALGRPIVARKQL